MILQSVIFSSQTCEYENLFYRAEGKAFPTAEGVKLEAGTTLKTNTYMNSFDVKNWKKYTNLKQLELTVEYQGIGHICLYDCLTKKILLQQDLDSDNQLMILKLPLDIQKIDALLAFKVVAETNLSIKKAYYSLNTEARIFENQVHIALIICTYKRNEQIKRNIEVLKNSEFYNEKSLFYGGMSIKVIDNASELLLLKDDYISIYHNPNTGGTGGFTRGIKEVRKEAQQRGTSQVIFMDDDVEVMPETFYRIFSFLRLRRAEYNNTVISGRMFKMEKRNIQHTAVEIWNGGHIIHEGHELDMGCEENLVNMNESSGEYTGWWWGCFPMKFVQKNTPFPFFLHCDDVEYGLRHGGKPIILNGIQVWHEMHESRVNPTIIYYDTRNALVVNALQGEMYDKEKFITFWKEKLSWCYINKNEEYQFLCAIALWHFGNGVTFFNTGGKLPEACVKFSKRRILVRLIMPILYRFVEYSVKKRYQIIKADYEKYALQMKNHDV